MYNSIFCVLRCFTIRNCLLNEGEVAVWIFAKLCQKLACSNVIKLSFCSKISDGFRQYVHSMCKSDAKEGTESFVLSQKSGRRGNIYPPPPSAARIKLIFTSIQTPKTIQTIAHDWFPIWQPEHNVKSSHDAHIRLQ